MKNQIVRAMLIAVLATLVFGCSSDKNSNEACLHDVTLNLDSGNYDAVLASPCADAMAKGAAWFGKAGFDVKDVINSLISANTSSTSQSDLALYMTALVPDALSSTSLSDLDNAKTSYNKVGPNEGDTYQDAQFNIALVDTVKSLSLIKIVIPNLIGSDGNLNDACDSNANNVPDDADATACELVASANINSGGSVACTGATYAPGSPVATNLFYDSAQTQPVISNMTSTISVDTFSGLTISIPTGTGDTSGCNPPSAPPYTYTRLLYQDPVTGNWYGATTTSDTCYDDSTPPKQLPCPVLGTNMDLVGTIDASLASSAASLISSGTDSSSDVGQSITDIKNQACTTPCTTVCPGSSCPSTCTAPYDMNYCTSQDISNYIENNLQ